MSTPNAIPADWRSRTTVDVPTAGLIVGDLCRNSAYAAAARGDLPTIRLGRRLVVPVAQLRRMLGEVIEPEGAA
ncbi:MAG: hypothetical protein WB565_03820 [Acidimicrobiales bacterium]